jgi:hypothetical protein
MTDTPRAARCIAFHGDSKLAEGDRRAVAVAIKPLFDRGAQDVLVFDAETSARIEFDLRGSLDEALARLPVEAPEAGTEPPAPRGPGRPKLGVVAREVTLLPRHWEWLAQQRGGASVALRRLVDEARRASAGHDRARAAQDAAYRFITVMAGDRPNYEEATRALFAREAEKFQDCIAAWPADVRDHARRLARDAFVTAPPG